MSIGLTNVSGLSASVASRQVLTENVTYYVRTDGSDDNSGLANTAGGAWATLLHAWKYICTNLDLSGFAVYVRIADGTYIGFSTWGDGTVAPDSAYDHGYVPVGGGNILFVGNAAAKENVIVQGSVASDWSPIEIAHAVDTRLDFQGMTLDGVGGNYASYFSAPSYCILTDVGFKGGTGAYMLYVSGYARVFLYRGAVDGNCAGLVQMYYPGTVQMTGAWTITGSPAWSTAFIKCINGSTLFTTGCTFTGACTGKRYDAQTNAVINTSGGGASYFPGDAAGTTATGGIYV